MKNTTKMKVDAGACRFITDIEASTEDGMTISLRIDSGCPHVMRLAEAMPETELFDAIAAPIAENVVFKKCSEHLLHAACPIPVALVKVCEVAADLCLGKDVVMGFE